MSTPAQPAESTKKNGAVSRIAGALALVSAVLAVILIVLGVVGLARVATPDMQGFNTGATVTLTVSGASIYARSDSERTAAVCTATKDSASTTLDRPTSSFSVEVSQSAFFEVARTPESFEAGAYAVSCEGTTSALYVGPSAPSTSASGLMGPVGLITGVIFAVLALGLGILAVILRNSGGKKGASQGASDYGGVQPGYSSPHTSPPHPASTGPQPSSQASYGEHAQQGPYGQPPQNDAYGQSSGSQSFAPPPPPSWQSRKSEETQAVAYGQGLYGPSAEQGHNTGQPEDHTDRTDGSNDFGADDAPDERGNGYPPPPPPPA